MLLFGALVALGLPGFAGTRVWEYAGEPGVPVTVELKYGGTLDGQLVGYEDGGLLVDHAIPKSEELEVVRKDGVDIVYVRGVAVGKAVEVRDFDVVVREAAEIMGGIYRRLHERMRRDGFRVMDRRYAVPRREKAGIALSIYLRSRLARGPG